MNGFGAVSRRADAQRLLAAGRQVARELALDCTLAEIVGELDRHGVRSLLLKGPAVARWLYEDQTDRSYRDIDLLVSPDQFEAARQCVVELGFRPERTGLHPHENADHHETWVSPGQYPAVVELHRTFYLLVAPPELVWQHLSAGAETIEVAGASVQVPRAAARALIVGLHAAQHGRDSDQVMQDLERALERADAATWSEAAALARELSSLPAFSAGLRLAPRGRELSEVLGISAEQATRSVRLLAATAPDTSFGIERLIATRGLGARLTLLARELAPSASFMRACYPLARHGRLGLISAYVVRPVRLALKLPGGIAGWLRAAMPAPMARRRRRG